MSTLFHIKDQTTLSDKSAGIHIPFRKDSLIISNLVAAGLIAGSILAPFVSLTLLWVSAAIAAYLLYCMRLSAREVCVSPTRLTIITLLGCRHIPRHQVRAVQLIKNVDLDWNLLPIPTLWGSNGMRRTPMFGQFTAYIGDPTLPMVRISLSHSSVIIAPADSTCLMNLLKDLANTVENK